MTHTTKTMTVYHKFRSAGKNLAKISARRPVRALSAGTADMAYKYTANPAKSDKVTAESWWWVVILRQNHPYEWLEMNLGKLSQKSEMRVQNGAVLTFRMK